MFYHHPYILDDKMNILGKVPFTELSTTIKSLNGGVYAIVFDGGIDKDLVMTAEKIDVKCLVAMETKVEAKSTIVNILTPNDF